QRDGEPGLEQPPVREVELRRIRDDVREHAIPDRVERARVGVRERAVPEADPRGERVGLVVEAEIEGGERAVVDLRGEERDEHERGERRARVEARGELAGSGREGELRGVELHGAPGSRAPARASRSARRRTTIFPNRRPGAYRGSSHV